MKSVFTLARSDGSAPGVPNRVRETRGRIPQALAWTRFRGEGAARGGGQGVPCA